MELNINSPVFAEFMENLNLAVLKCLTEILAENFSGGEINAKIIIEAENACEVFGDEQYNYKKPTIDHKVIVTLKKREEAKGYFNEKMELFQDDAGVFFIVKPKTAQMEFQENGGEST